MKEMCKVCDINQIKKVSSILGLSNESEKLLLKEIKEFLDNVDMKKTNPEVMGEVWKIMTKIIDNDNPYEEVKEYYNKELLNIVEDVEKIINSSEDNLNTALKIAISGNLIDFAAKHTFDIDMLKMQLKEVNYKRLAIDDSETMFEVMRKAKTLMYLGDNCGEIVLDKIFIKEIKKQYPNLKVFYGVRGKSIVNDVTIDDANMVNMVEVANVISNGDLALGTVLENTSEEFQRVYMQCDMVICKGQGNYESLLDNRKEQLYFLFMAKCENITKPLKIPIMSIVCLKNRLDLKW